MSKYTAEQVEAAADCLPDAYEDQAAKLRDYAALLRERESVKAQSTRLRKVKDRVKNGVCPCCNRTFVNLQRHMHTKHPSYDDSHES